MTQATNQQNSNGSSDKFDQPVVLRQSPALSRSIVWVILALTVFSIAWAAIAKIEQVVTATGKLQPQGDVKEVEAPINGVVKKIFVKDGDVVEKGQPLLTFDSDTANANKTSLLAIQQSLTQENQLYRAVMNQNADIQSLETQINAINLPPEVTALARNRLSLVAQTQVLRAQLGNPSGSLNKDQADRLTAANDDYNSKVQAANLELQQLSQRLAQNQIQLADSRTQLKIDQSILTEIRDRNKKSIEQANTLITSEENIFKEISDPKFKDVIARLQIDRQKQQVNERKASLIELQAKGDIEVSQQQQRIDKGRADINQFLKEEQRLQLDIQQAKQELINAKSSTKRTVWEQLDNAKQQLAAIDSELNKVIVENTKRLSEVGSQLAQAEETIKYQTIPAPIGGTVFDLKATEGNPVGGTSQAEALLKIVPTEDLIAEVFVTNKDIGFVLERCLGENNPNAVKNPPIQPTKTKNRGESSCSNEVNAEVRIDSYSFSKYKSIHGKVLSIGSDALPPDQIYPYYRFPVRIKLDEQSLELKKNEQVIRTLPLQSGMSVNVNLIIQEKRSVLSLMTDLFDRGVDAAKRSQ